MGLTSDVTLSVLRAIGEGTRLRIVSLLERGELTVTDLTNILGQSQPRISRHLKLLSDAGVVDKHREGTWAFFDLVTSGPIGAIVVEVLANIDPHDAVIASDLDRLSVVRARRTAAAQEYFTSVANRWDQERSLYAGDEIVEAAIIETLGATAYSSLLDLGTGTGRMLQLLATAPRNLERAVGLDSSHSMLAVARANLERAEIRGVDLRQGDVYSPPVGRSSFDLIIVHQVLHFLDDPARAVREASLLLSPGGRLLIIDLAPHSLEFLRSDHAHRRLGFRTDTVAEWLKRCELDMIESRTIDPPVAREGLDQEHVSISLWLARDRRRSPIAAPALTRGSTHHRSADS